MPAREITIPVLVALAVKAVYSSCALVADRAGKAGAIGHERTRSACTGEAEQDALGCSAVTWSVADAVDRDYAADRFGAPQRRLRSPHDLDPRGEVCIEDLEPWRVTGRRIVDLDAIDEDEGVIG